MYGQFKLYEMATNKKSDARKSSVLLVTSDEIESTVQEWSDHDSVALEELTDPMEDLIATAEATYEFIRNAEMDQNLKRAFWQLESKFETHKKVMELNASYKRGLTKF